MSGWRNDVREEGTNDGGVRSEVCVDGVNMAERRRKRELVEEEAWRKRPGCKYSIGMVIRNLFGES